MIESAVTDLPQPDSPTTPSVPPFSIEKSTPSTARMTPPWVWKPVRRFETRQELGHARASSGAGLPPPSPLHPRVPFGGLREPWGTGTAMCRSSWASMRLPVARLQRREQVTVLFYHRREILAATVAVEVGADPGPDRPPDLHRVGLARGRDHDFVEAEVGLDVTREIVRRAACSISQTCLPSSAKSSSVIRSRACAKL